MKSKKIYTAAVAALVALSMALLPGCGGLSGLDKLAEGLGNLVSEYGNVAEDWEKYEKAREGLTNYKIVVEAVEENGNKAEITEVKTDIGYALVMDGSITYVDYGSNTLYTLSIADKTGIAHKSESGESYKGFGAVASTYLYAFEVFRLMGAKKVEGSEKIAGRNATVYIYDLMGYDCKFWVDSEYGLTLKSIMKNEGETKTTEVREFKIGGVMLGDVVNLGEYDIKDLSEYMN